MDVHTIDRSDWLLMLVDGQAVGADDTPLDPVRLQKALFLLSMRGPEEARELYSFRPYNWGPYSSTISGDVDALVSDGLLQRLEVPGQTWNKFVTTAAGSKLAAKAAADLNGATRDWLAQVRRFVTTRGFSKLLRDVYDAYPEYAVNSRFR